MGVATTYRLTLAYLGGAYGGWQRQPNRLAVQQVVEEALGRVVGGAPRVVAASRTDAGVHARAQQAHVRLPKPWSTRALVAGTNHYLPPDVRVMRATPACPTFHARAWAVAKEYRYRLSRAAVISPFEAPTCVPLRNDLDVGRLRAAARQVEGRHDFEAFARSGGSHRHTMRTVFRAEVIEEGAFVILRFVGDGFLRGMVRALVGTLLEAAEGARASRDLGDLLTGRPRSEAGPSAPARGLTLVRVFYPDDRGWAES